MGGIVWLASYPKSGNTWLRAFLHNLMLDPPEPFPINELTRFTIGDTNKAWYANLLGKRVDELRGLSHEEWARLRPHVHQAFTRASPDSVFVKTHMFLGAAHGSPLITMEYTSGAIYMVRDPRDVAVSAAAHFGTDIDGAIRLMNDPAGCTPEAEVNAPQYYGTWSSHVDSWTRDRHPALLVLRYEDLLADPRGGFRQVADFLGLPAPPARLDKAIAFSSFDQLQKQEKTSGFSERSRVAEAFFRVGSAGQWRTRLTTAQIAALTGTHAEMMRKFGYLA
jgi:hypothetical protein